MIDTLVLRIHDCKKNSHIVKYLEQTTKDNYVKRFKHEGLTDTSKSAIMFGDTGNIIDISLRTSVFIASSHYSISALVNEERDFIELNLSIPKYVYSTNVLQFIDPHDTTPRHVFNKLLNFISEFFYKIFPAPPMWEDVEVNRIDLCFNQFFLSKADALRYLEEQRNLNLYYARSDKNKYQSYGTTTVQYVTDNYSFKIYHKGTEFQKNDYNKLVKNNPKGFNLSDLKDTADKILRYEMSCKKGLLNYIFKQKLKDDPNTMFNHNLERIQKLKTEKRNNTVKAFKMPIAKSTTKAVEVFIGKTVNNKTFSFFLESAWDDPNAKPFELLENFNLPFSVDLFECLHSFFWERVQRYQLGVKMGLKEIHDKIKEHQETKEIKNKLFATKEKVSQTGQLLLIATLSQYTDISDLKTVLPKATYYRYVKKLEELGIPKHSPDIAVLPPALDYSMYFFYFGRYHFTYN